ncbi:unnamed protein product [Closterium sp. NIES-65]|nr:unnamed protein product [Closterium sp. NIES-65]
MSWIRSNLAKVGTFAGSVVQKAGDAVERGAKMVYEQAESAVVGRPHNSFRHAVRRIEEVATFARGSERKEALARWLAALSDIQQENDRLQAHFQRRKKRQEKGEKGERKTQEENKQEEVTVESAASADGSAATGAAGAAAEADASDAGAAGAAVSSDRTDGLGAEGVVADRAGDEGKDGASVTEGNQAKDGEGEGVGARLSQVQTDGAEGKTESVAAEADSESKDGVVGDGEKTGAEAGSKSAEAGDIAAAGEEAEEVASVGDGSSQDEAAPSLSKSASTGRASMVLFYDPDAGNEALNFRDVFLRSSALELIVASMVVAPGDEDEMALLRGLFDLCLNLSTTQCNDLLAALQSLGSSLSAYSELKLPSDDLATMVAEAITGLKVNPEIERVDLESCRLQQLIAEAASVAASVPAAHQRSASFVAAFDLDDLATDATSAGAVASDAADAADATSGAVSTGSRGGDDDGGGGGGADGGDTASSGQASTETAAAGSAASSSGPAAPAEADGAAAAPAATAEPTDIQSEPAAKAAASPPPHTISSPPPHTRDAVTHVNEVVTARSRDALRLGLRLLALEKKKEALLQLGDTPGDRALKVERVSCLAAELSESMEGLRRKAEECRQQRQEALAYRSSKAQESREAEKAQQQVQARKEELEVALSRVQAALLPSLFFLIALLTPPCSYHTHQPPGTLSEAQQVQKRKEELMRVQVALFPLLFLSSCLSVLLAEAQQVQKRKEEPRRVQAALLPSLFSLSCFLPDTPYTLTPQVLLAEAQQVQKRKEELEEELRRVQAALDGVNRRLVKLEEEKELFSQASTGIETHLSSEVSTAALKPQRNLSRTPSLNTRRTPRLWQGGSSFCSSHAYLSFHTPLSKQQEESLTHSLSEHEEDAKALAGWKEFLQQSWQLQQASMEGKERRMREEKSDRKSRFWEMAQGHVRLCQSELEAFGQSAKSIVERLDGIRAKREQAEKEGKDGAVSDSKHRRLQWEERYMAAEIQSTQKFPPGNASPDQLLLSSLTFESTQKFPPGNASPDQLLLSSLTFESTQKFPPAAAGAGGAAPTGTEENVPPTPFVISGGIRRPVAPGFKDKQGKSKLPPTGGSGSVQSKQVEESTGGRESMGEEKGEEGGSDAAAEAFRQIAHPSPFSSRVTSPSRRPSRHPLRRPLSPPLLPSASLSPLPTDRPPVARPVGLSLSAPFPSPSLSPLPSRRTLSLRALPVALSLAPPFPSLSLSPLRPLSRSSFESRSLSAPFPSASLSTPFPSHSLSPLPSPRPLSRPSLPVALSRSAPFPSPSLSPLPSRRTLSLRSLPIALSLAPPFPSRSLSPLPSRRPLSRPSYPSRSLSPRPFRRPLSRPSLPIAFSLSAPPSLSLLPSNRALSPLPSRRALSLRSLPIPLSLSAPFPSSLLARLE